MGMFRPALLGLVVAGLLVASSGLALAGGPIWVSWPSPVCPGTLQQCIDTHQAGSEIRIETGGAVNELIEIEKDLTLRAVPGYDPIIDEIRVSAAGPTRDVIVADLRVRRGIEVSANGGSGHSVTIRGVRVVQLPSDPANGDGISFSASVPASFAVLRSRIHTERAQASGISLNAYASSGLVTLRAVANRIDQAGNGGGGSGIDIGGSESGSLRADVMNNVIRRVAGFGGGGISVSLDETVDAEVNVVGNTVEGSRRHGLLLRNDVVAGGSLALRLFGNVFAWSRGAAIVFDPPGQGLRFKAGANAFFRNGQTDFLGGRSLGKGNVRADPRFVDRARGDLRLRSSSPLVDRGIVCSPGGIANPDAAGRHRLAGRSTDIGAYEHLGPPVTGIVAVGGEGRDVFDGTDGRDILCGRGGYDKLFGYGGADYIDGGAGGEWMDGGAGRDRLYGGPGTDIVCGNDGRPGDLVNGGPGRDWFDSDRGDVLVSVEERRRPCDD
jgi:hypothetical protein